MGSIGVGRVGQGSVVDHVLVVKQESWSGRWARPIPYGEHWGYTESAEAGSWGLSGYSREVHVASGKAAFALGALFLTTRQAVGGDWPWSCRQSAFACCLYWWWWDITGDTRSLQRDGTSERYVDGPADRLKHFPGIAHRVIACKIGIVFTEQLCPKSLNSLIAPL